MGDVIHALPVAAALHAAWPETKIRWIVDPRWQPLLENHPAIAELYPFPRTSFRGWDGKIRAVRWYSDLRQLRPDLTIDLQGLFRSGLMSRLAGSSEIHGLSDAREFSRYFYHQVSAIDASAHAVDRYLGCLETLGIQRPPQPEFSIFPKEVDVSRFTKGRYIIFHPFARGAGKALDQSSISAFIAEFAINADIPIVLVGAGELTERYPENVVDLTHRTTLAELVALMRGAAFVVSVDSGPMHLAAAVGSPLLGIHTWSDPRRVGPYRSDAWIWQGGAIRLQDLQRPPDPEVAFTPEHARTIAGFVAERLR